MRYIKDDEFIRGKSPMTKEEIRILSIAKMELEEDSYVLDVGAGTGSISIQAAKICTKGNVTCIERDIDAIDTIYKNKEKFSADNLTILEGSALSCMETIDRKFDSIFIGGSGGELTNIIDESYNKLKDKGTLVLNFITINNLYMAMDKLKSLNLNIECSQISVSKTRGNTYMLMASNSIFILKATKKY